MSATALAGPGRGGPLGGAVRRALLYLLTAVLSLMFVFPFVWTLSSSLKTARDVVSYPPALLPPTIQWENYPVAWTTVEFGPYFLNSTIVTVTAVVGGTLTGLLVAYGFSRFRATGRDFLFTLVLATLMIPYQVRLVPEYLGFAKLGMVDTYWPWVLWGLSTDRTTLAVAVMSTSGLK